MTGGREGCGNERKKRGMCREEKDLNVKGKSGMGMDGKDVEVEGKRVKNRGWKDAEVMGWGEGSPWKGRSRVKGRERASEDKGRYRGGKGVGNGREGGREADDGLRASSISCVALLPRVTKGSRSRPRC